MGKKIVNKKDNDPPCDILRSIEHVVEAVKGSGMSIEFKIKADAYIKYLAERLGITERQAVLFAVAVQFGETTLHVDQLGDFIGVSTIRMMRYAMDIDALRSHRLIRFKDRQHNRFAIPAEVMKAIKYNKTPEFDKDLKCDSVSDLFAVMADLFEQIDDYNIESSQLYMEMEQLFEENSHLQFVQEINKMNADSVVSKMILLKFCHHLINKNDNNIIFSDLSELFEEDSEACVVKNRLRNGTHFLLKEGFIEYVDEEGIISRENYRLTKIAREQFLSDFKCQRMDVATDTKELKKPEDMMAKPMFYSKLVERQVGELSNFFNPTCFDNITQRMRERGFRCGFTCLFYGDPGTGKTETAYQIAKKTGRSVMAVNVPEIKSKWVGDSEKNVKELFDKYRSFVKEMPLAPILLFNEADALIGIRKDGASDAVDKMENTIQNIILQEMETLEGIMIATTNLQGNFDPAFERRFLYKIKFEQPDVFSRISIWRAMIPELADNEAEQLGRVYHLSGGQIENVARKYTIHEILYGHTDNRLRLIADYCDEEPLAFKTYRVSGFS